MPARIADLASNRLVQATIANTQQRIMDRQLKISTLQKSQDYAGISDNSSRLVTLEASRIRINKFMSEHTFVQLRMDTMLNSVDALKNTINDVRKLLREALDDGIIPNGINKDDFATVKMGEIEDFLNVRVNGRYLFAGSKTDTKPVQPGNLDTAPTFGASNNSATEPSFYYQGDDITLKARIDEGVEIKYGVTAADAGFEKLIRAVRILKSVDVGDANYIAKYQDALDLVISAEERFQGLELGIGTKVEQLDTTHTKLDHSRNFLSGIISDIESIDTFTAIAEITQDQTMLEASYATLMKLSRLHLTSYF
jgi:flagellar hook-associated protein 3 FlgL